LARKGEQKCKQLPVCSAGYKQAFHCQLVPWMHSLRCVEVQTTLFLLVSIVLPVSIVIPSIHPDTPLAMMAPAGWGLWGKGGG
jgi:hypothetical protein